MEVSSENLKESKYPTVVTATVQTIFCPSRDKVVGTMPVVQCFDFVEFLSEHLDQIPGLVDVILESAKTKPGIQRKQQLR
jgi:hypothetical protein